MVTDTGTDFIGKVPLLGDPSPYLGMVKADEIIYQFPNSEKKPDSNQTRQEGQ